MTEIEELRAEIRRLKRQRRVLVKWAVYSSEEDSSHRCRPDHDGACQTHGGGSPCRFRGLAQIILEDAGKKVRQ